jgi:hypothetical protein
MTATLWAAPSEQGSLDIASTNDGVKVQVSGNYAYLIRADGTPDFAVIDISNPSSPSLVGSLSLTGIPQNLFVSGNYAYVSSSDGTGELKIINISSPSAPSLVGTYNAPGTTAGSGLYVVNTTAYLLKQNDTKNNEFFVVNVATPSSPTLIGSLNLGATDYELAVSGNYAFLASSNNSQELQVVSIATPSAPSLAGSLNLSGNTDATTIALMGTVALVGQGTNFYTVDISTPTSPAILGSLGLVNVVNDIALNLGNGGATAFLATSNSAGEFVSVNVSNTASPAILGQFDVTGANPLLGIAYSSTLDRAVGAGQSDTEEFIVLAPQ